MNPFRRLARQYVFFTLFYGGTLLIGGTYLTVDGTYDFNGNGRSEILIFGGRDGAVHYVELDSIGNHHQLWAFSPDPSQLITDIKITDLNGDGIPELLAGVTTLANDGKASQPWLMVFPWEKSTFAPKPFTLNNLPGSTDRFRPLNLSPIQNRVAVSLSSPSRKAVLAQLDLSPDGFVLTHSSPAIIPLIKNGYGPVFTGVFTSGGHRIMAVVSPEGNLIKTALFSLEEDLEEISSDILVAHGARGLLGPAIQPFDGDRDGNEVLLLPFETGDVLALSFDGESLNLEKSPFHEKGLFTLDKKANPDEINGILLARVEEGLYESPVLPTEPEEKWSVTPEDTLMLGDTLVHFILPDTLMEFYGFRWRQTPPGGMHFEPENQAIIWVPRRSNLGLAKTAFTVDIRTEEKLVSTLDNLGDRHQMTSVVNSFSDSLLIFVGDTTFIQKKLSPMVFIPPRNYAVNVFTKNLLESDRYVFEGEPPYGVNTILFPDSLEGVYTSIQANLNSIRSDKTAHFSFKSTAKEPEKIVTLSLIHDMESNVLYTSIHPPLDSLPQSFHPEQWDSDLFQYPEYFYEGFPGEINIDSASTGLAFSLPEYRGHEEGVVGLTSPLDENHEFRIYYSGGIPHAIRGEVRVKENGTHKTITEIDFTDFFRPLRLTADFTSDARDTIIFFPDTTTRDTSLDYAPAIELIPLPEVRQDALIDLETEAMPPDTGLIEGVEIAPELPESKSTAAQDSGSPDLVKPDTLQSVQSDTLPQNNPETSSPGSIDSKEELIKTDTLLPVPPDTVSPDTLTPAVPNPPSADTLSTADQDSL